MGDADESVAAEKSGTVNLEDIFDDADEEFPASSPPKAKEAMSPSPQPL